MRYKEEKRGVTLTLYPNTYGLSFLISDGPKDIIDYGIKQVKKKEAKYFLEQFKRIMDFYEPGLVILRDYDHTESQISVKYRTIWNGIEEMVNERKMKLLKYSRKQIREVFEIFHAKTKYEISRVIANWYPQLKSKFPRKRKPWQSEDYYMSIFDSFSLMLTHAYIED